MKRDQLPQSGGFKQVFFDVFVDLSELELEE